MYKTVRVHEGETCFRRHLCLVLRALERELCDRWALTLEEISLGTKKFSTISEQYGCIYALSKTLTVPMGKSKD